MPASRFKKSTLPAEGLNVVMKQCWKDTKKK